MRWIGHAMHAGAELDVGADTTLRHAHGMAHLAEAQLVRTTPKLGTAVVHAYPAHRQEHLDSTREVRQLDALRSRGRPGR